MHGVFNKVLTEDRKLPIVRLNDPQDKRLAGLMITQLVLEDGWIGLAIGPGSAERTAERTRMLRLAVLAPIEPSTPRSTR